MPILMEPAKVGQSRGLCAACKRPLNGLARRFELEEPTGDQFYFNVCISCLVEADTEVEERELAARILANISEELAQVKGEGGHQ